MTTHARALRTTIAQRRTERGATLVEVMIAGAIGLIVILGVNGAINRANLNVKAIEQKNELRELEELIKMAGTTEVQCQAIFAGSGVNLSADTFNVNGTDTTTQDLTRIVIPNKGNQVIQPTDANLQYIVPGLRVSALTLERPGTSLGGTSYQGWLQIEAEREEGSNVNKAIAVKLFARIPVNFIDSNANGQANSCLIGGSSNEQIKTELVVAPVGPADCVGSTHAAIQECLDLAAASNPARGVLVKAGTYTVTTAISMPANTTIRGEPGAVLVGTGDTDILFIGNASSDHMSIKGLTFNQNAQTGSRSAIMVSLALTRILKNITIEGNQFINNAGAYTVNGIRLWSEGVTYRTQIIGNTFGNYLNGAADTYRAANTIRVSGGTSGVISGLLIDNNRIDRHEPSTATNSTIDFSIGNTFLLDDVQITNNTIVNTVGTAIDYQNTNTSTNPGKIKIANNYRLTGSGGISTILLDLNTNALHNFEISDNIITATGAGRGIYIIGTATNACDNNNTIHSNNISGSGSTLPTANGIDYSICVGTVSNNTIRDFNTGIITNQLGFGHTVKTRIIRNNINPITHGIFTTGIIGPTYIAENHIQSAYMGMTLAAANSEIYNNTIVTTTSPVASAGAACGGVSRIGGICFGFMNRAAVKGNTIRVLSPLGTSRGIMCASGGANTSSVTGNRFFDSANAFMSAATAIDPACTTYLTHTENSDGSLSIRSGGNVNVSGGGGINVGTGAPTASNISVNGSLVVSQCEQVTATLANTTLNSALITATCPAGKFAMGCTGSCQGVGATTRVTSLRSASNNNCRMNCTRPEAAVQYTLIVDAMCCTMGAPF